jgi:hypothetical protein
MWDGGISDSTLREILDPKYPFVIVNTDNLNGHEEVSYKGPLKNAAEANLAVTIAEAFHKAYKNARASHNQH